MLGGQVVPYSRYVKADCQASYYKKHLVPSSIICIFLPPTSHHCRESYSDDLSVSRSLLEYSPVPSHNGLNLSCSGENPRVPNSTLTSLVPLRIHCKLCFT